VDPSGFRIVDVDDAGLRHRYVALDSLAGDDPAPRSAAGDRR